MHGVMARDTADYRIVETWDTLGMRATASQDTVIEGAFVPDQQIIRTTRPGFAGADEFILTIFGRLEPAVANIYTGLAEGARDLAIERIKTKRSVAQMTRSMAYHPGVQQAIADIVIEVDGIIAHADRIAADWTNGVDHGDMWRPNWSRRNTIVSRAPSAWSIERWTCRVAEECSKATSSNGFTVTPVAAGFTQLMR